jgi:thioredoxin reductase
MHKQKFPAHMLISMSMRLACDLKQHVFEVKNIARISARTVVIATGVKNRRLPLNNLPHFEGVAANYSATIEEA